MIPLTAFLAGLLALGLWCAMGSRTHSFTSGMMIPQFVDPARSRADVAALADTDNAAGARELLDDVLRAAGHDQSTTPLPGERDLVVGYADCYWPRVEVTTRGWPVAWLRTERCTNYQDAVRREGFLPATTDATLPPLDNRRTWPTDPLRIPRHPRMAMEDGVLVLRPPPEETGGVWTYSFVDFSGFALVPAVGVVAWACAGLIQTMRRGRSREAVSRRRRWRRGIAIGAMTVAALVMTVSSDRWDQGLIANPAIKQTSAVRARNDFEYEGFIRLPWTVDAATARADEPGFALEVAAAIASAAMEGEGPYLAVTAYPESRIAKAATMSIPGAFRLGAARRLTYERRPSRGEVEPMHPPPGLSVEQRTWGTLVRLSVPKGPVYEVILAPERIALVVLGLFGGWWLPRTICVALWKRGKDRRLARGLCPQCGYEIGLLPP